MGDLNNFKSYFRCASYVNRSVYVARYVYIIYVRIIRKLDINVLDVLY